MPDQFPRPVMVVTPTKSVGAAVLLAILFGPLGMLYATVLGGIIMLIVSAAVALPTLGFGLLVTQPICVIWAAIATNGYNKRVLRKLTRL